MFRGIWWIFDGHFGNQKVQKTLRFPMIRGIWWIFDGHFGTKKLENIMFSNVPWHLVDF